MSLQDCKIKYGRRVGYLEYNRIWKRLPSANNCAFEYGTFVSPSGESWRPCGLHYPGLLLVNWDRHLAHSVDFATARKLLALGWIWRPDSAGEPPEFKISRWPDGTHYYVSKPDGDLLKFKGKEKFDTYDEAHKAGSLWAMKHLNRA